MNTKTTFKSFIISVQDEQLDEGKIFDFVKSVLGTGTTEQEIEDEIARLKSLNAQDFKKIQASMASKDFHERKAAEAKIQQQLARAGHPSRLSSPWAPKPEAKTVPIKRTDAFSSGNMSAAMARAVELDWTKNS